MDRTVTQSRAAAIRRTLFRRSIDGADGQTDGRTPS